MARARNIKPGFFKNEDLAECSPWARLCFIGLWGMADREGRLEDRPKRIKAECFAYDSVEVDPLLNELARWGFIARYSVNGVGVIQVLKFAEHQTPHFKEVPSTLPPPPNPGLDPHSMAGEPKAPDGLNGGAAPTQTGRASDLDGKNPDSMGGESPLNPESGFLNPSSLNPDTGFLIPDTPIPPTPGEACMAMKRAGLASVNPSNAYLIGLLHAGITVEELVACVVDYPGKPLQYVLTAAESRRREAASIAALPPAPPPRQSAADARRAADAQVIAGLTGKQPERTDHGNRTVDVESRVV